MSKYCIDTSALMDGWVRYYPRDIWPGLWTKLDMLIQEGRLFATEEVLRELKKKNDALHRWAKERKSMFRGIDEPVQSVVLEILAKHQNLIHANRGRSGADPWVIALAKVEGGKVITGERKSGSLEKPKMPDVCEAVGVPWMTLVDLCREQKWVFEAS